VDRPPKKFCVATLLSNRHILNRINPIDLETKIEDHLKNRNVERKVYIRADKRVQYVTVKQVLDAVRSAGIIRVGFLADRRWLPVANPPSAFLEISWAPPCRLRRESTFMGFPS
jgi:hypothetical protein